MKNFTLDKYKKARGGWSRMLSVSCSGCGTFLFNYQKDGPGPLKRSYLDRIDQFVLKFDKCGYSYCPHCKECLGFNEPYKKENNRPAIRWAVVSVSYKIVAINDLK